MNSIILDVGTRFIISGGGLFIPAWNPRTVHREVSPIEVQTGLQTIGEQSGPLPFVGFLSEELDAKGSKAMHECSYVWA